MPVVAVADRRRSVVSAVFCALVVCSIPAPELQRHHRRYIPPPTSPLRKTGRSDRMTVPARERTPRVPPEGRARISSPDPSGDRGYKRAPFVIHVRAFRFGCYRKYSGKIAPFTGIIPDYLTLSQLFLHPLFASWYSPFPMPLLLLCMGGNNDTLYKYATPRW